MTETVGERERDAVFGYGSLVSLSSLAEVLGRPAHGSMRACLPGWRRRWSLLRHNLRSEKTFELADGSRPTWILSLNVERAPDSVVAPNGLLFDVSEDELVRLDSRERRYDRVDVTDEIDVSGNREQVGRVYTYVAKAAHHAPAPPDDAVVLHAYLEAVEQGFAALGPDELDAYRRSTEAPSVDVAPGILVADAIPEGNPRGW